ncbi:MAG: ABC transporter ATP-binding protein [Pseudomonadota bacterium]
MLDDVSFELPAGGSLAIVGRTGSGKSSLAVLLARLQPTPRGSVFLDGVDVCDLPLSVVRESVGYAQQNAFLFSTTVARNIAFSLDEPDAHESILKVEEAAREACIEQEVLDLPDGFDTVVGERGVQLSGGQKQRVALAAAFASEPKVLVLDDPLSAVDASTERAILDAIDRQRKRRGLILITHRVAAAAHCDQIIVLEKGRVVERGTHQELSKNGGIYAIFAEEQRIERELAKLGGHHGRGTTGGRVTPPSAPQATSAPGTREQRGRADKKRTERILKAFHEEERFGKAYDARLTKRLWGYLVPYRLLLWASLVVILLTSVGALVRPLIYAFGHRRCGQGRRPRRALSRRPAAGRCAGRRAAAGPGSNVRRAGRWRAGGRGLAARGVRVLAATAARFSSTNSWSGGSYRASPMTRTRSWRCSRPER